MADRLIQGAGEDAIAIMDEKAVGMIGRYGFAQLLKCPGSGGVGSHIGMQDFPARMLNNNKHIEHAETQGNGDTEIAGHHGLSVVT
jgi:hypothetical protein